MATKLKKVSTQDLLVGMYVSQLDRPWIETPFPLQGFHLRTENDISKVRAVCKYVYIDEQLGTPAIDFSGHAIAPVKKTSQHTAARAPAATSKGKQGAPIKYQVSMPLKQAVAAATTHHKDVTRAILTVMKSVRAGNGLDYQTARQAGEVLVKNIIANPDAMIWLARVKEKDSYSYHHSVRASILATIFGRHLGLDEEVLNDLATGVLLCEVGKTKLSRDLLNKPGRLTEREYAEVKKHVEYGVDLLSESSGINERVLNVVRYHHERHDGSGYPHGLGGNQIPLLARIAGIVDVYDAITSPRPYAEALTSTAAVSYLYDQRDKEFHGPLVERFIQSIGVYPTGTLVQLSNKEVGVVIAQNERRLRPRVMLVLGADKQPLARPKVLDLMKVYQDEKGDKLTVTGAVKADAYNLDLKNFQVNAA